MTAVPIASAPQPAAAEARDVLKVYGTGDSAVRALDRVSVRFERGSFTAVMGPSGSGKSTLMHVLAGLDTVDGGQVLVDGASVSAMNEHQRTVLRRERIGFVFQAFNLIPALTARENITLPLDLAGRRPDAEWIHRLVTTFGLERRLGHLPAQLSGGQQQRVAVARALASKPALVFADEPTGNLDTASGTQLLEFLRAAVTDLGQTIVMVTHDPVAASYADRVVFLTDGRVVGETVEPTVDGVLLRMRQLTKAG